MAIGDIKTYKYLYNGLELQVDAIDIGSDQTQFIIKCISGTADVNALYWNDFILDTLQFDLGTKKDNSLNMNGTGVDWDGGLKLSSTGLGAEGVNKATFLTAGEDYVVASVSVKWDDLNDVGVRATSTSTAGGSIKAVDTEPVITKAPPQISISDTSVVEGGSPTTDGKFATFNVTMDHAVDQDMLIFFHTSDGSAVSSFSVPTPGVDNADYFPLTGGFFAIMPAGATSTPIDIPLWDDHIVENPETFTVTLTGTNYPGATIVDAVGVATIIDNDGPPQISISDTSVVEGGSPTEAGKFATFNVTMDHAVDQEMRIFFHTSNGTAVASGSVPTPGIDNADYFPLTGGFFAIMPAGATSTPIDIPLWDDHIVENPETFTVTLTGTNYPGATIIDAVGVATIIDNDTPISSALNDALLLA